MPEEGLHPIMNLVAKFAGLRRLKLGFDSDTFMKPNPYRSRYHLLKLEDLCTVEEVGHQLCLNELMELPNLKEVLVEYDDYDFDKDYQEAAVVTLLRNTVELMKERFRLTGRKVEVQLMLK